ncbi:hypothetical protein BDF14DRAFT_1822855 [Spinellus fusiger]|nr:hypothetical protein BDF14DRAFT_1822855 [Spinellus fusiger]
MGCRHSRTSFSTEQIARVLLYEVVLKFGVPTRLITDNGANFISEAFVTFAYNTAQQVSTGLSPFEIMFGRKATLPLEPELIIEPKTYETENWTGPWKILGKNNEGTSYKIQRVNDSKGHITTANVKHMRS